MSTSLLPCALQAPVPRPALPPTPAIPPHFPQVGDVALEEDLHLDQSDDGLTIISRVPYIAGELDPRMAPAPRQV
jgi:hypothetical protein